VALDSGVDLVDARLGSLAERIGALEMEVAGHISTVGPTESSKGVWDVDDFVI
jgi:hypothetical protein